MKPSNSVTINLELWNKQISMFTPIHLFAPSEFMLWLNGQGLNRQPHFLLCGANKRPLPSAPIRCSCPPATTQWLGGAQVRLVPHSWPASLPHSRESCPVLSHTILYNLANGSFPTVKSLPSDSRKRRREKRRLVWKERENTLVSLPWWLLQPVCDCADPSQPRRLQEQVGLDIKPVLHQPRHAP